VIAMSRRLVLALALASLLVAAAGCGSEPETDDAAAPPAATPPSATSGTANTPPPIVDDENEGVRGSGGATASGPPAVGEVVPDLAGSTLAGDSFSLSELRGKKVIVHLWSSW
jgi:hypothetical protein